jgi:two-component system NtrC family sensor kinase
MRLGLRARLLLGFLLVLGLVGAVGIPTGFSFISRTLRSEAMRRVEIDLGAAWAAFEAERVQMQTVLSLVSQLEPIRAAFRSGSGDETLRRELETLRLKHELDVLTVVDATGRVLLRSRTPYYSGDALGQDPIVKRALSGQAASGTALVTAEELRRKAADLAERAYIPIVYTERAAPTDRTAEDRGLVLEAAMPILDAAGGVRGALVGGILLNRKFSFVDRIRDTVFGDRTYEGKPVGTVTLFLGDVRIATNVMLDAGTRAVGTRVWREVGEKVLERGERFADRAFVVNDWYLSAYDPIRDPEGRVVGIIYVGLLEKAYLQYRAGLARSYLAVSLLAVLASVVAALLISSGMRRPVARLVAATRQLAAGNLDARVAPNRGSQELVELAQAFNSMAEALAAQKKSLEEGRAALETAYAEAAEKNRAYLEMLGFVTHELKSPLASIVFGIGSLREGILGPLNEAQQAALRSSAYSADYLQATIANYLNLSRLEEGELRLELRDVSLRREVVAPLVERLSELAAERGMRLATDVSDELVARCDRPLVASVFENLVSNAIKYGGAGRARARRRGHLQRLERGPGLRARGRRAPVPQVLAPARRSQRHAARHGPRPLRLAPDRGAPRRPHLGRVRPRPLGPLQLHAPRGRRARALRLPGLIPVGCPRRASRPRAPGPTRSSPASRTASPASRRRRPLAGAPCPRARRSPPGSSR